ncbi:hypothetical protein GCM10017674_60950 [Streptomyces gardneri]|uniref:Uncharacterized protein n=1 Tax=Streptomyces gardneri TaxID=66892 RepID=A0A4Y3RKH5_9ACTN|nr:hypothetical protein SGA01_28280 [Streptomyces gardneri]GHH13531.1 hypothetical protein GCM10017674_60950 [Streptomyces gardneri]
MRPAVPVYWRWTPTVAVPFFIARLVDHAHGLRIVQVLDHVGAYVISDRVGVPFRTVEQVLHAVRSGVADVLGQGPAVLARQVRQQPGDQPPHPAAGFNSGEPARDPTHQALECFLPVSRNYAGVRARHVIIGCPHNT